MGGVASVLGKAAVGIAEKVPHEAITKYGVELTQSLERGMRDTAAGNDFADLLKTRYTQKYHEALESITKLHASLPKAQQAAPEEIQSQARNIARTHALGRNDYRGVGLIKAIENEPGLTPIQIHQKQQVLADHVHMFLKDTKETAKAPDPRTAQLSKRRQKLIAQKTNIGPQSEFKMNVKNAKENAVAIDSGAKYSPPGPVERFLGRVAMKTMLPAIAIPHIGTLFNYASNTPIQDLVKGVAQATFDNKSVQQFTQDSGIFGSNALDAYAVRYHGARGIIAKATGNDAFGTAVNLITHQPGFNQLRHWTISIGAASGKLTAERMAEQLIKAGGKDKIAEYELRRLGLVPADVIAKGGLDPDMIRKAVFSAVDRKVFLDNTMSRSFRANQNTFYRMAGMYHGYVSRQGKLMYDVLKNEMIQGKAGRLRSVQAFATLGIVFPTVGLGLKSMQMWGRGQFNTHLIEDEKTLYGAYGLKPAAKMWVEGMSHMAAFGVATDYMRGASRHLLINSAAGPVGNEIANLAQDSVGAFSNYKEDDPNKSFKPLERDLLEDTLPLNLGKLISHQMLPTTREESEAHPSHKLKHTRKLGMKKLKKLN